MGEFMLKSIMLLFFLGLAACAKNEDLNYQTFTQTESTCSQPATELKTMYVSPFSEGTETYFVLSQTIGTCKIRAELKLLTEGHSVTVTQLKVYDMTGCNTNETLDFEQVYTYRLENNTLTLSSNACTTKYKNEKF